MISAKVIEDSLAPNGVRLTTMQLKYPRFVHAEFMTHRVFSRNASSSRAIPVEKVIKQVREEPAMPMHWGRNQAGMQAAGQVDGHVQELAMLDWLEAAHSAAVYAEKLMRLGLHKQVANRLLEPFQFMHVVVTATDWRNFYELRDHEAAEPHMQLLARAMRAVHEASEPVSRPRDRMHERAWHLPYVSRAEREMYLHQPRLLAKVSAARCARVSYMNHDGTAPVIEKDVELFDRLAGGRPMHASPLEHQGYPAASANDWYGNFRGWQQHRKIIEFEIAMA